MATITLRVPDELDQALQRQSNEAGVSKSDLAREALRRFLAVSEFQRLRAKLVRRAQAQACTPTMMSSACSTGREGRSGFLRTDRRLDQSGRRVCRAPRGCAYPP